MQGGTAYDLEERTKLFAIKCRNFTKRIPQGISNREYIKQFVRSSGSVAANYIEANESLSRKDYYYRVKICRKETKETLLWLDLIESSEEQHLKQLKDEAIQLMKIFGAIVSKSSSG